jgi:hypothetical protein
MTIEYATNLVRYFELLTGLTGIVFYYKKRQSIWFAFAVFSICLFGLETLGHYFGTHNMYKYNTILYKWIVIPLLFLIYHLCYYAIMAKKYKPVVIASYCLFALLALLENLFLAKKHYFSISFALSYGCVAISFFSIAYFYQLIRGDDILKFKTLMPFWFCLGMLLFWLVGFPQFFFVNIFAENAKTALAITYRWIFIIQNYIMYILFTIGYIWSSRQKQ